MKWTDLLLLVLLIGLLAYTSTFLISNSSPTHGTYKVNDGEGNMFLKNISGMSYQFYPNMRYPDKRISYYIEPICADKGRTEDIKNAFLILENKTILEFYPDANESNAEIVVLCSELPASLEQQEKGHFIAGEGGPTEIINTTSFSLILSGKISLYQEERCKSPNIVLHEILHVLGFDHNNDSRSILFPITGCYEQIDSYIIDKINELYKIPSEPELGLEKVEANRTGKYLNFAATIMNYGLRKSVNATLEIYSAADKIDSLGLGEIDIGMRRLIFAQNIHLKESYNNITFEIKLPKGENDLFLDNNKIELSMVPVK